MTETLDARIGIIHPDGRREFPALTVAGKDYERPATTLDLGERHFVVLDPFPPKHYPDLLDEVKALLPKTVQATLKRQEKKADEAHGVDA